MENKTWLKAFTKRKVFPAQPGNETPKFEMADRANPRRKLCFRSFLVIVVLFRRSFYLLNKLWMRVLCESTRWVMNTNNSPCSCGSDCLVMTLLFCLTPFSLDMSPPNFFLFHSPERGHEKTTIRLHGRCSSRYNKEAGTLGNIPTIDFQKAFDEWRIWQRFL